MYTPIKLDKTRNFRYGMKALNLIEKKFNKNIASIDFENLTIEGTMTIIWAGLVHEDKDLTPEALIDIIDNNGIKLETIVTAMSEALQDAFGPDEVKEPKNTKATVE
jgi:hypothetical protein